MAFASLAAPPAPGPGTPPGPTKLAAVAAAADAALGTPPSSSRFGYAPTERSSGSAATVAASPPSPAGSPRLPLAERLQAQTLPRAQRVERSQVLVHACGRLESVVLEHLTVAGACSAARLAFDFPQGLDLALARRGGQRLDSDEALRAAVAGAETLYAQLTPGALRDFERRAEELQHMQLGFLTEQLAALRREQAEVRAELRGVGTAVERERGAREVGAEALRRELAELRGLQERHSAKGNNVEALEVTVLSLKQAIQDESATREQIQQENSRRWQDLRQAVEGEGGARERAAERMQLEIEAVRRAVSLEVGDREEAELRTERGLQALRASLAQASEAQATALQEARRQLLDAKQAVAVEQRERIAADADLANVVQELRVGLQSEARERAAEAAKLAARCEEAETSVEAERLARQQAVGDLTQQLTVAVESIQEEQALRSSEDVELSQMVETLRRSVEEARRRADESEMSVSRMVHDFSKRVEEEVRTRDAEVSRLLRKISDENEARQEEASKIGRSLASLQQGLADEGERRLCDVREVGHRVDECLASLQAEQKERLAAVEELSQALVQHRTGSREASAEARELREAAEKDRAARVELEQQLRAALAAEQQERAAVDAELAAAAKDSWAVLERETQMREKGDLALSRNVAAAREALEEAVRQQEVLDSQLQQGLARFASLEAADARDGPLRALAESVRAECLEEVQADLDTLRDGVAKVVEAVQQERRSRAEGDSKLREDCREAIQKEINARLERDAKTREDLEAEARLRQEAVEVIQLAIEECRAGLESHTHELQVDDTPRDHPSAVMLPGA